MTTTPTQIDELLSKMETERAALIARVTPLNDAAASERPENGVGEGEWSVKEQLAHLWEMERSYIAWVQAALRENGADLTGVRGEPTAIPINQANQAPVSQLLHSLAEERTRTTALIRSLSPEAFDRTASQPMFGALTVLQWLRSFYRHDRMHADQIAGREPEYKPRFVSGVEPDQRRR